MSKSSESGNVLFYIFLGVVLFAALNFAVSQNGRENLGQLTNERDRLAAVEIIDYSDAVAKAVTTLRLRGIPLKDLRFSHPDLPAADYTAALVAPTTTQEPENMVFDPAGGGALYKRAPSEATTAPNTDYMFLGGNAVQEIGTTCNTAACADLMIVIPNMRGTPCDYVNRLAKNTDQGDVIPANATFDTTNKFKGVMSVPQIINAAALIGKPYGCLTNSADGLRYFYRVLWSQ